MTREEQRILREMKAYLDRCVKTAAKDRKMHKRDGCVYLVKDRMFCSVSFFMCEGREIIVSFKAKPFWLDDLLWTVLQMEDNIKQPVSLRGTGAFTIRSEIKKEKIAPMSCFEDIDAAVSRGLDALAELSDTYDEERFLRGYKNIDRQNNELRVLVPLHQKRYSEALDELIRIGNDSNTWSISGFYEETLHYISAVTL